MIKNKRDKYWFTSRTTQKKKNQLVYTNNDQYMYCLYLM